MTPLYERVNLVGVDLVMVSARTLLVPAALPPTPPSLAIDAQAEAKADADPVLVMVTFNITGLTDEKPEPVLDIKCQYRLAYEVLEGAATSEEADQLAQVSGVFNAWPYFRELVSSLYCRMNLPLPLVPSLTPNLAAALPWQNEKPKKGRKRA